MREQIEATFGVYTPDSVHVWNDWQARRKVRDDVFADHIIHYFRPGKVLELGSAVGMWVERLRQRGFDVLGSDYFEFFVEEMKRKGLPARTLDATNLPCDLDGQFDTVFCDSLSPQMDKTSPEATSLVYQNAHRVLKPGGRFIALAGTYVWGKTYMQGVYRNTHEHAAAIWSTNLFDIRDVIPHQIFPSGVARQSG